MERPARRVRRGPQSRLAVRSILTPRQTEMAPLLAAGLSHKDIAARMGITEGTSRVAAHKLYRRLGLNDHGALTQWMGARAPLLTEYSNNTVRMGAFE